jgi:broad-specificity NMP kinase
MSYYVIIRGPAGVGKSTVSKLLAEKINADVVNFDIIMDKLGLDYMPGDKWIPLQKFLKADEIMLPEFREKLESGNNLILDGNFYHKEQIEDIISKLDFSHMVFTLKADLKACIERDKSRNDGLGEQATKDVFELVSEFDYGINIDTAGRNALQIVDEIVRNLDKFSE